MANEFPFQLAHTLLFQLVGHTPVSYTLAGKPVGVRDVQLHQQGYLLSDVTGDVHRVRVAAPLGKLPCPKT